MATKQTLIGRAWRAALVVLLAGFGCAGAARAAACPALLDRSFPRLQDEKPQSLCQYTGKVLLVVNTASFCGFTPQYRALEALHARYQSRGLVVLGFPTNDFGAQEPGDNRQIAEFCENTYGVKFPMFTKSRVRGAPPAELSPLIAELARRTGSAPQWNFHKYLVARDGVTVASFPTEVDPGSSDFVRAVEKLLDAK